MASNQTQIDAPPPHTAVPKEQAKREPMQQLAVQQPTPRPNMPSAPLQVQQTVRSQQPVRGNPPGPQVQREFYMNANEARRANERNVLGNIILLYPNGEDMEYTRSSIPITCQHCSASVVTIVEAETNGGLLFLMIIMMLICLPFGICFLLCLGTDEYVHKCPNCGQTVGICGTGRAKYLI